MLSELLDELEAVGLANRGTDLGGLLQWAMIQITNQNEALIELRQELEDAMGERNAVIKTLEAARTAHTAMNEALRCDFLINPYLTCGKDITSHVNSMMANGVEPYAKKKRVKK